MLLCLECIDPLSNMILPNVYIKFAADQCQGESSKQTVRENFAIAIFL